MEPKLPYEYVQMQRRVATLALLRQRVAESTILTERERGIARLRLGLCDGRSHTLREVGERIGVTPGRVRDIEQKVWGLLGVRVEPGDIHAASLARLLARGDDPVAPPVAPPVVPDPQRAGTVTGHTPHPGYINPPEWPAWGRYRTDPGTVIGIVVWAGDDTPQPVNYSPLTLIMPESAGWVPPVGTQVYLGDPNPYPGPVLRRVSFYDREADPPRWRIFGHLAGAFLEEEPHGDTDGG